MLLYLGDNKPKQRDAVKQNINFLFQILFGYLYLSHNYYNSIYILYIYIYIKIAYYLANSDILTCAFHVELYNLVSKTVQVNYPSL